MFVGAICFHVMFAGHPLHALSNDGLDKVQAKIEKQFPNVSHLGSDQLADLLQAQIVLFDVRAEREYLVSHISGAHQISPGMSSEIFLGLYGELTAGKVVVFYCSVGRRSSDFADRTHSELTALGAQVFNLQGGLFEWHNEERPLVSALGPTEDIHPYNWFWARHINRQELARYRPRTANQE